MSASHRLRLRTAMTAGTDCAAVAAGFGVATLLRFGMQTHMVDGSDLLVFVGCAVVLQAVVGMLTGLYRGRFRYGSFDEIKVLGTGSVASTLLLGALDLLVARMIPLSAVIGGGLISLVLLFGIRCMVRLLRDRSLRPSSDAGHRVLVFGAGEGAEQAIRAMLRNRESAFLPVAIVDDDPANARLRVHGVPVVGTRDVAAQAVETYAVDTALIAIPSASGEVVRGIADLLAPMDVEMRVLPHVSELFDDVRVSDMRVLSDAELLGRHEIQIDKPAVASFVRGKRILVTGAGGSIGSELCRQLAAHSPERLVMLDRDESALHAVQMTLTGNGLLDDPNLIVADIRDRQRVDEVFAQHAPDVVFHAAALKHLPLLEMHPFEAVKTNIWGTVNVLDAALHHDVARFVNISTDKAANPASVLGFSKRIGERLTAEVAGRAHGTFVSVRFGNVLGSRGSVLTAFRAQIESGGPVTVTDPHVTRFFMTVQEAVLLVIQAAAIGHRGETLILDMGTPVLIADVARRLAESAERPIDIVYTGLRPGEKLEEELFGEGEQDERPTHPLISHVPVPPLDPEHLGTLRTCVSPRDLRIRLRHLCDTRGPASIEVVRLYERRRSSSPTSTPSRTGSRR